MWEAAEAKMGKLDRCWDQS